ncbi:lipid-A-disaccharide synthase [Candidatus Tachikawaea gelatinosa]|uniref:Lipid-A-disaccharide synthase n=2 Tax=Candidatus Tachikawaea gelatinosa TaxID=1410383 RepID=A0A090ARJ3_9ENTR|nr:lipid-A-disaccharide synthase [Candidatus Tachikawaea gelatinosa]
MSTIKKKIKNVHFVGISGPKMKKLGFESWYNISDLSVIGIFEIFKHILHILKIRKILFERLKIFKPDVFIGIDSPDFNLPLEGRLKKIGIPIVHYVSPSIWAWRKKRIKQIVKNTNLVLLLFPFEKQLYINYNIPHCFVGHAIANKFALKPNKKQARKKLGLSSNNLYLAILPGSRLSEIKMLSVSFIITAKTLCENDSSLRILLVLNNVELLKKFKKIQLKTAPELFFKVFLNKSSQVLIASDIALVASGTATLECLLAKCPMVIGYKVNILTFFIVKSLIKIPYISLPNILTNKNIVKEFIQNKCTPLNLTKALQYLLYNVKEKNILYNIFYKLHKKLRCNSNEKATQVILKLIKNHQYF